MAETKRFSKNDGGFVCANCGRETAPLIYTSRNHCPHCLHSLHVDVNPGDRKNPCGGVMKPVSSEPSADLKAGYTITFRCEKCGAKSRNRAAKDDTKKLLIALTNPEGH